MKEWLVKWLDSEYHPHMRKVEGDTIWEAMWEAHMDQKIPENQIESISRIVPVHDVEKYYSDEGEEGRE